MSTLTNEANKVLGAYQGVPYYNNKRKQVRMGLRALVGKGTPQEIADEALLYSLREKVNLKELDSATRKRFLVDHNLGIDCSGFLYHILDAESKARGARPLCNNLVYPFANSLIARFGRFLRRRYAENADVRTFAHKANSRVVPRSEIAPGDFLVRMGTEGVRDHVILITSVEGDNVTLAQSVSLPTDGRYDHGVREEVTTLDNLPPLSMHRLNWF